MSRGSGTGQSALLRFFGWPMVLWWRRPGCMTLGMDLRWPTLGFEAEEIEHILAAALRKRDGVRFVIALALGLRQGEALGLKWARLHEPSKTLEIRKGLQRQTWQHGCADPHTCGTRYHKSKPCPRDCRRHQRPCPPPCPPDCTGHARWCPDRRDGGLVEVEVKSAAGRRGIALPDELFALITEHRHRQDQEREHAGTEWHEGGWMFTQPTGKPIDPRRDHDEWKALLQEAGVSCEGPRHA